MGDYDITFGYKVFDCDDREMEEAMEKRCTESIGSVLEILSSRYPVDMGFSVWVCNNSVVRLNAYTCEELTKFDISSALTYMPTDLLVEMLDSAMSSAAHEDDEDPGILPPECLKWIHNNVWMYAYRGDFRFGGIGRMEPKLVEAIRKLKDTGLLDSMPSDIMLVRSHYDANVIKRRVWIPECLKDLGLDTDSSVPDIMKSVYRMCFLDHIVDHAVYGEDIDAPTDALENEMMDYATAVADGE